MNAMLRGPNCNRTPGLAGPCCHIVTAAACRPVTLMPAELNQGASRRGETYEIKL
jgi:hypothetical protein